MEEKVWKKYLQDKRVWVVAGIVLAAVLGIILYTTLSTNLTVTATSETAEGIAPDTAFVLTVSGSPEPDALRRDIAASPEIGYDLSQNADGTYQLTPLAPLEAGSGFTITLRNKTFSFKVANTLLVRSCFPGDGSVRVPVNSGVEFTFNTDSLALDAFKAAFSIDPPVEGEWSLGGGRFSFWPTEGFQYGQKYTVTLTPPLASDYGAALPEAKSFTFVTASEAEQSADAKFQIAGNGITVNVMPDEVPLVQAYLDESISADSSISVTLRSFADPMAYQTALRGNLYQPEGKYTVNAVVDTTGLEEYTTFNVTPFPAQHTDSGYNRGIWVLPFPETLPLGWYAVDFTLDVSGTPVTRQMLLQVSDLSVFYMALEQEALAWINDTNTGLPVENASVEMQGTYNATGATSADGTAALTNLTPAESGSYGQAASTITVTAGDRVYVDADYYYSYMESDTAIESRKYMTYLFTDRPIYHTTDTIQVWGTARPRDPATPMPQTLTLDLAQGMVTQEVSPAANGTFTATLSIENMAADYWANLNIKLGDVDLKTNYLRIEDFVKPIYTATAQPQRPVYLLNEGDVINVDVNVSMFDGTPASSFGVNADSWGGNLEPVKQSLTTDKSGHISAGYKVTESLNTWYPQSLTAHFSSTDAMDENFSLTGYISVIHRDLMLDGVTTIKDGKASVAVATNRVDISRIQTSEQLLEKDAVKGNPVDVSVTGQLHKVWYEKTITGTHYNFITRTTEDSFSYDERDEIADTLTFATTGGVYTAKDLPVSDDDATYYLLLIATDSRGKRVEQKIYLGLPYERWGSFEDGTHRYQLQKIRNQSDIDYAENSTGYYWWNGTFRDGENTQFAFADNDTAVDRLEGKILYGVVKDRIGGVAITDSATVTLPFGEELLPNYMLAGAYFDGKRIFSLQTTSMSFNPDLRELDITIQPEKDTYAPGDHMSATATVQNKVTGAPAADANLVVSVVDEAVFAVQEQDIDILERMYASVHYPYVRAYTSYLQNDFGGPGEMGGGGGDNMRKDFADTAFFQVLKTDAAGKASFTCPLPDNLTSWRITSLALTDNSYAGSTKTNVRVTKDYFVNPTINDSILVGDSFVVGLRSAGVAVDDADPVRYKVSIKGDGVDTAKEADSTVQGYATVDFGSLAAGDYTITVEGACGQRSDGIQLPFNVVASGVEVSQVGTYNLADGIQVDPLRYPVSIGFYSKGSKTYNTVFSSVMRSSGSTRADMRIARKYTALALGEGYYNEAAAQDSLEGLGGRSLVALMPYDQGNVELSVKARLAAPDLVGIGGLKSLEISQADWYAGAKSSLYLAQALAGNEVNADLDYMLQNDKAMDFADQMYLAMAMAQSGDTDNAQGWYSGLVTPNLREITGMSGEKALYVHVENAARSDADNTALASMLATMLEHPDAEGLVLYLAEKKSDLEPYLFEQMYYLTRFSADDNETAKFSYQKDGKTVTETLYSGSLFHSFNKQQLAAADFKVLSGEVMADVYYAGAPDQMNAAANVIKVRKAMEPVEGGFTVGNLIKVTLTPDLTGVDTDIGQSLLVVDDHIPSGMRFDHCDTDYGTKGWYLGSRQGQRLQFTIYGAGTPEGYKPLVYYVRCATPGDYVVESAYISSASGSAWGMSDRETISID